MADVGIVEGELLLVMIASAADPNSYVHPCYINTSRGINFTTNVTETEVADCANQSAPAKIVRKAKSVDFTVQGAGKVDALSIFPHVQWQQSGLAVNAKIVQDKTGAQGGFTGVGQLICKDFNLKGERGDYQEVDATYVPASPFVWTANA